jgi:hypothetical protein
MSWMQRTIPFGEDYFPTQEAASALALASGDPADLALFVRTADDMKTEVLLISPVLAKRVAVLPGVWTDAADIAAYGWTLLFGHADANDRLGLRTPREAEGRGRAEDR